MKIIFLHIFDKLILKLLYLQFIYACAYVYCTSTQKFIFT